MHRAGPSNIPSLERGYTLVELVVITAIVCIVAACGYEALAQRPAHARSTAVTFAALIREARALAAVTGDAGSLDGTGASIGVVRDGETYVATLYSYRPMSGALHGPVAEPNSPPLRTSTALGIVQAGGVIGPPFALFFSASGHVSAQAHYSIDVDAALANEPACPLQTGIVLDFADGISDLSYPLSCEMAQLDLDAAPLRSRSQ